MSGVDSTLLNNSQTSSGVATSTVASSDRMNDLTTSDFIKMMVAELQHQDPMDPMSNTEMLSQISQMRQITSSDKLSAGIESLIKGEALATASSLIGKTVTGVDSLGENVTGKVDKVTIEGNNVAKLHIGNSIVDVTNVTAING
ncbi:MAG: flagellar hook capping protein [Planctomycetaceae bacterium]|jgi:flagellar basal-body rod modification protein FlgD|nr:flagellar hook capping protein [Planctomycetaceae bacterium]